MTSTTRFYIDGRWVSPVNADRADIINPSIGATISQDALGGAADAKAAIAAAGAAFAARSVTSRGERLSFLRAISAGTFGTAVFWRSDPGLRKFRL